jgi:Nuclear fragile X mental retardation-interacting protein 1 (NUFIP1)/CCCH-type zinc finger
VPCFGGDILPSIPPSQPNASSAPKKKPRKHNQLGLTPASQDHESSSDEDEEAKLANTTSSSGLLQIEYKGRTATLQTAADIAAWIAERRKNFPTAAKVEAAKWEADEKRRKWEESKKERAEAQKLQRLEREKTRQEELRKRALESVASKKIKKENDLNTKEDKATKAALKTEKLKRRLEKAQRDARKAEEALARMQEGSFNIRKEQAENTGSVDFKRESPNRGMLATLPIETEEQMTDPSNELEKLKAELLKEEDDASTNESNTSSKISLSDLNNSEPDSEDDTTSSSGSSSYSSSPSSSDPDPNSDSDVAPEELTSKRTAPDRIAPPPRIDPCKPSSSHTLDDTNRPARNLCRNIIRTGRCPFGTRCRYSHDLPEGRSQHGSRRATEDRGKRKERSNGKTETGTGTKTVRKGLYQVLVEKEVEDERRAVLTVIMDMGERGLLDEPEVRKAE